MYLNVKVGFQTSSGHATWIRSDDSRPRTGGCNRTLEQVKPIAVEQWFRGLELAQNRKLHIRCIMHVLYECAARWGVD